MLKVGLASFAHMHAWSYARHLADHLDVELAAAFDRDPARGAAACKKLGIDTFHDRYAAFLSSPVDAVIICSENARHAEDTELAARAGKHVLCEKPLATTPGDGARMIRAARDAGVHLMTAFPCRFHPAARRAREAIRKGSVGRVLAVNGTNHGQNPGGWFVDPELSGGGAIMDHTVHVVDLLRWMTGAEAREVYAEATNFDPAVACEDGAILSIGFEGFFATLDASWSRPPSAPVWGDVTLEVIGTEAVLSVDLFAQEHVVIRERDARIVNENWGDDMDRGLIRAFVAALAADREPDVTGVDGLRAVEVVDAAYRSVRSGRPEAVKRISP